jgi:hypothetical protein
MLKKNKAKIRRRNTEPSVYIPPNSSISSTRDENDPPVDQDDDSGLFS